MTGFNKDDVSFIKQLITRNNVSPKHEVQEHLDNTLPIKKLKGEGTAGQIPVWDGTQFVHLPAPTSEGSVITSDTTQTGGVKWVGPAFQVVSERTSVRGSAGATTNFVIGFDGVIRFLATNGSAAGLFYMNPSDWGASGVVLRLQAWAQTETDPADSTLTVALARMTGVGGTSTIGATSGSSPTTSFSVTAANTMYSGTSTDVTLTTAGHYLVYFGHSVNPGALFMTYGYTLMGRPA